MDDNSRLIAGLDYLRAEAMEAHIAGDGVRAEYMAIIALREIARLKDVKIEIQHCRWSIYLGLYWMIDEWFLHVLRRALDNISADGGAVYDSQVATYLLENVDQPPVFSSASTLELPPKEWLQKSCECL